MVLSVAMVLANLCYVLITTLLVTCAMSSRNSVWATTYVLGLLAILVILRTNHRVYKMRTALMPKLLAYPMVAPLLVKATAECDVTWSEVGVGMLVGFLFMSAYCFTLVGAPK